MDIRERELLFEALLHAFNRNSLQQMLLFKLGKRLDEIAGPGNMRNTVFDVITASEMQGWTDALVHAAHDANPNNPKIKAYVNNYVRYQEDSSSLERMVDEHSSFLDINRWRTKLGELEHQVCQIKIDGDGKGTGFLIGPDLVLTNYHVINGLLATPPKGSPDTVRILFDFKKTADEKLLNDGVGYRLDLESWLVDHSPFSPDEKQNNFDRTPSIDELDFAVLKLAPRDGVLAGDEQPSGLGGKSRGWITFPSPVAEITPGESLFILQHPNKAPLKMALQSNSIISVNANMTRMRHRTLTEGGSSGSPCFDKNWNLIGLHHAGQPGKKDELAEWNQAVPVQTIVAYWERHGKLDQIINT